MQFRQFGVQPGEVIELKNENMIPKQALKSNLDKTHEMIKKWKQE